MGSPSIPVPPATRTFRRHARRCRPRPEPFAGTPGGAARDPKPRSLRPSPPSPLLVGYELAKRMLFELAGPTGVMEMRVPLVLLAGALATVVTCFLITPFEVRRRRCRCGMESKRPSHPPPPTPPCPVSQFDLFRADATDHFCLLLALQRLCSGRRSASAWWSAPRMRSRLAGHCSVWSVRPGGSHCTMG